MGEAARRRATWADLEAAPDGLVAELLGGELHLSPRPAMRHMAVETDLAFDLQDRFGRGSRGPDGWRFIVEPELHLGVGDPRDTVAVPDVAGWRLERLRGPDPEHTDVPDWVCEILSPGPANTRRDRVVKPDLYASRGVAHLWLVDPDAQVLEVYRLQGSTYARIQAFVGPATVRAEPFDAAELDLGRWWGSQPMDP